ncbi:MAG: restriction endonuclease [Candidatus Chloroheliales bacterium]|nr:MAG: restriction endonuclease [Chloroflexota bacterium]
MAKMQSSKGRRDSNSGYVRMLGNKELGQLFSRVQATVIRMGNELEALIVAEIKKTRPQCLVNLEYILNNKNEHPANCPVLVVYNPKIPGTRADFLIVDHSRQLCKVVELKDGDTFDTKKSSGELDSLNHFAMDMGKHLGYDASYAICSFNQSSVEAILKGTKGRFRADQALTGKQFCELIGIDYDGLVKSRQAEQQENLDYLLDQMLAIPAVRELIQAKLSNLSNQR